MKDGYKIKIYLTKDSFEDIAVFDDIYPNLNRIFRESAVFILDMTEDELDKSLEDVESDFAIFCNSHNIKTTAQVSVLNNMLSNRNELIKIAVHYSLWISMNKRPKKYRKKTEFWCIKIIHIY